MPLSEPAGRDPVQSREVDVSSFRRHDGKWDVEGRLVDISSHAFPKYDGGMVEPGVPIHDMRVRLTLDAQVEIVAVEVSMDAHPYPVCPAIVPAFQRLKGERIGPGWNRKLRDMFGGIEGCVHVVSLLGPVGTIGFKTVQRESGKDDLPPGEKPDDDPYQVNGCHALASDSEIVRNRWPELYTGS